MTEKDLKRIMAAIIASGLCAKGNNEQSAIVSALRMANELYDEVLTKDEIEKLKS